MTVIGILDDNLEVRQLEMVKAIASWAPAAATACHDNAPDFIRWLKRSLTSIRLLSLDHDLGPSREQEGRTFDPGTGMDVVDFLVSLRPLFPVIVHSSNPLDAPTMVRRLEEAGWAVRRVVPFMEDWIPTVWLQQVRKSLAGGS